MASFDVAVPVVLNHEGGIKDIGDGAGITAFGWTEATCKALGIVQPGTVAEARALYKIYFWSPVFNDFSSQTVATKVFDDTVNQGPYQANLNLQRALADIGFTLVIDDGRLGPVTVAAANRAAEAVLLPHLRSHQMESYRQWVAGKPDVRLKLLKGLAARAAWPDPDGTITPMLLAGTYLPWSPPLEPTT